MQQKSQVAPAFLKRRIRPRYIRIKVNAKFPRASRHFRWLTPTTAVPWKQWGRVGEGEGASGNWEERKRNEDESERTTEENGYFFFFLETGAKEGKEWAKMALKFTSKRRVGNVKGESVKGRDEWVNEAEGKLIGKWERNCSNKIPIFFVYER